MAKICDICGAEYEAIPYRRDTLFRDLEYTDEIVVHRNLKGGGQLPPKKYEVCGKCMTSFNRWRAARKKYMKGRAEK